MRTKYGNKKVEADGYTFDSQKEYRRYAELRYLSLVGDISTLMVHPPFVLQEGFRTAAGEWIRAITVKWDFAYKLDGVAVVEDVKSPITRKEPAYNIRKKLFMKQHPFIRFVEVL